MRLAEAGVERVDVAGPGFMNFWLDPARIAQGIREVVEKNESFGRSDAGHDRKMRQGIRELRVSRIARLQFCVARLRVSIFYGPLPGVFYDGDVQ